MSQAKQATNAGDKSNKVKATITRAEAIQQREQLRQMVLNKFINDLARNNKKKQAVIEEEVNNFFKSQKITEQSLKELKTRVHAAVEGKAFSQTQSEKAADRNDNQSVQNQARADDAVSVRSQKSQKSQKSQQGVNGNASGVNLPQINNSGVTQQRPQNDDALSYASSKPPASVYYLEGDEEDEWATLVKFDTELYKKEQELEKQRQAEFKKKMKNELDRQLKEKERRKQEEKLEENAFVGLQRVQIDTYDRREKLKEDQRREKIMNEKKQRDKQVHDENVRRKLEKKREKELDEMLVQRIKEEKEQEEREQALKKEKERQRLLQMMRENEDYRKIAEQEAHQERENDIRLQNEYIRLQEEMQAAREAEKRQREEKIKRIMSSFADSVVKDQKAIIREEDAKMMRHILDQNERERQDEERRKHTQKEQKGEMREFLKKQINERDQKKRQEDDLNKLQAEIWQKDRENYLNHEQEKHDYIKLVNKKHQAILVDQMKERDGKAKKGKMNVEELLQNKSRLKEIASVDPAAAEKLRKQEIQK